MELYAVEIVMRLMVSVIVSFSSILSNYIEMIY
jgi:hypothetical protein